MYVFTYISIIINELVAFPDQSSVIYIYIGTYTENMYCRFYLKQTEWSIDSRRRTNYNIFVTGIEPTTYRHIIIIDIYFLPK